MPRTKRSLAQWQKITSASSCDMETLIQLCESIVLDSKNAGQLEQYKLGGKKVWKIEKFFVGKIMGASKGNGIASTLFHVFILTRGDESQSYV